MSRVRLFAATSFLALACAAPALADPVITPIIITAAVSAIGVGIGATTIAAAGLSVAAAALAAGAGYLMQRGQVAGTVPAYGAEGPAAAPANGQRTVAVKAATPPRRIVYGTTRVSGVLIFQDNDNPYLYLLFALSDGEIDDLTTLWIGATSIPLTAGVPVAGNSFENRILVEWTAGTSSETASATLLAAFPTTLDSNFRQRGVARMLTRLHWGDDATMHNALWGESITPSATIDGVKVVDPRTTGTSPSATTARVFSANPALCVAHALHSAWDMALGYGDIDWVSVVEAANDCDVSVTHNSVAYPIFSISGIFQSGHELASQIAAMLSSFGGAIYFADGAYRIRADKERESVWTLGDDDIYEIGEYTHEAEQGSTPNAIKARYADAGDDGVDTISPTYTDAATATEPLNEVVLSLPFTPRSHSAQIMSYRELTRARDGRALSLTVSDAGLYLEPYDVITIASVAAPWLDGKFQVIQVDLTNPGCNLQLRGYDPAVYRAPSAYLQ